METNLIKRCSWCNLKNPLYVAYHDLEWGHIQEDDRYLFEMLLLESFQAGLSWECVLNKREHFRIAFDAFDPQRISQYGEEKVAQLLRNPSIIRNRRKILSAIQNAAVFLDIQKEYGSFWAYLKRFTGDGIIYETGKTTSCLSDRLSADLYARGMRFVGSTILYSYLQAIGVIDSHDPTCYLYKQQSDIADSTHH